MNKKLLISFTLWVLWQSGHMAFAQTQDSIKDTLNQTQSVEKHIPQIIYTIPLSPDKKEIIESVVKGYFSLYSSTVKTLTISSDVPEDEENEQTLIHAKPHCMYINPEVNRDTTMFKNAVTHDILHTIKPDTLQLTIPFTLQDDYTIIGYHWLSVVVQKWNVQTQFTLFEEAVAEACAFNYDNNYSVQSLSYANLLWLMLGMIRNWRVTPEELISYQSTNGVGLFCEKILARKILPQDIESLMGIFNAVSLADNDPTDRAIQEIQKLRK